jgi:hypothetical protein
VARRVGHGDLRGHEGAAVVGPSEQFGRPVVLLDEGDDPLGEVVERVDSPWRSSLRSRMEKNNSIPGSASWRGWV